MARPAKSTAVSTGKVGKAEKDKREREEKALQGSGDSPVAPKYLSRKQKSIFNAIEEELSASGILCALDSYILAACAVSIDRTQTIEAMINENPGLLENSSFMASKEKYARDFYRCCNELCLSPQARAKLAGIKVKTEEKDPVREALGL